MRINFVSYLNPFAYQGGGELELRDLILAGEKRGHSFYFTYVRPKFTVSLFNSPDFFFLADLYNFDKSLRPKPKLPTRLLCQIISGKTPYIHFDNAYVDVCDMGYLPCNGLDTPTTCPVKLKGWPRYFNKDCFSRKTRKIYSNAALCVFVSPLQRQKIQSLLGSSAIKMFYEKFSFIDNKLFYNKGVQRDIQYLFVGAINEAKGLDTMRCMFNGKEIVLVGNRRKGVDISFGTWLGTLPYEKMPDIYNRAVNLVFLPRWPEPFGRVVLEAALCGCNLITNDNAGACSYGLDLTDTSHSLHARDAFWDKIEEIVKR